MALCTAPLCAAYADDPILLPPAKAAFVPVELAGHVGGLEPVLSVTIGSETKAYPLRILAFHGVINDVVAGTPLALSYCGPCGTVGAFKRAPEMFLEAIYDRDKTSMMLINKAGAKWAQKSGDGANTKKGAPRMLSAVPSQVVSMARVRQSATGDQVVLVLQDTAVSRVPTPKTLALPGNLAGTRGSDEDTGAVGANQTKVLDARSWSLDLLSPERRLGNEERLILLERKPAVQAGPPAP
ncbi:MAG: DUF3179 domain-containing (seleno)protein [Pseudomonadota bacterium]